MKALPTIYLALLALSLSTWSSTVVAAPARVEIPEACRERLTEIGVKDPVRFQIKVPELWRKFPVSTIWALPPVQVKKTLADHFDLDLGDEKKVKPLLEALALINPGYPVQNLALRTRLLKKNPPPQPKSSKDLIAAANLHDAEIVADLTAKGLRFEKQSRDGIDSWVLLTDLPNSAGLSRPNIIATNLFERYQGLLIAISSNVLDSRQNRAAFFSNRNSQFIKQALYLTPDLTLHLDESLPWIQFQLQKINLQNDLMIENDPGMRATLTFKNSDQKWEIWEAYDLMAIRSTIHRLAVEISVLGQTRATPPPPLSPDLQRQLLLRVGVNADERWQQIAGLLELAIDIDERFIQLLTEIESKADVDPSYSAYQPGDRLHPTGVQAGGFAGQLTIPYYPNFRWKNPAQLGQRLKTIKDLLTQHQVWLEDFKTLRDQLQENPATLLASVLQSDSKTPSSSELQIP